jgi:hypothetical protein
MTTRAEFYKQRGGYWTVTRKPRRCDAAINGQRCMTVLQPAERIFISNVRNPKAECPCCSKLGFCAECANAVMP